MMRLAFKYRDLWFLAIYGLMLVFLFAVPSTPGTGLDRIISSIYLIVAVSAIAIHLIGQRPDNWLRPDILFLVGFFVVHYQWLMMILVSEIFPVSTNFLLPLEAHATYGAWLSTIALVSWLIGYVIAKPKHCIAIERVAYKRLILTLIAAIVVFSAFIVTVDPGYFTAELYRTAQVDLFQTVTGISAYFITITEIFTLVLVSVFFYPRIVARLNVTHKNAPILTGRGFEGTAKLALMFYFVVYLLIFLMAGERGQVIQLFSAIGVVYAMNFRAIRFLEFAILAGLAALIFTSIGIIRSLIDESITLNHILGEYGYWGLTRNLANSSITLYQGINLVHTEHGFYFGQLWLSQILGLIPFLQSTFLALTGWESQDVNSASLITAYILSSNIHTGFGTSFVIDIYLNFSIPGVIIFSFIYGYICKFISEWITGTSGFNRFFVAVTFVSLLFYVSRSSLLIQLRPVVWGLAIVMLFVPIRKQRSTHSVAGLSYS